MAKRLTSVAAWAGAAGYVIVLALFAIGAWGAPILAQQ